MIYLLEPEVAGELGERTIIHNKVHPPIVDHLHFVFIGWLGDDLIECFPCFLVSEELKNALESSKLSGFNIIECDVDISKEMKEMQPDIQIPNFFWLKIFGNKSDDFFITKDNRLAVTSKAFKVLGKFQVENCDINKES